MKNILPVGLAFAVLAALFVSCENAYEVTVTDTAIPSLPGPADLKAVNDYDGVVTLTWKRVDDAAGYRVYRRTDKEPEALLKEIGEDPTTQPTLWYNDIINDNNVFKKDVEYVYTVVALSSRSTSARGVDVVQNGKSETRITPAKVPAKNTAYNITVAGLGAAAEKNAYGISQVVISWEKDPNPGIQYDVLVGNNSITSGSDIKTEGTKNVVTLQGSSNYYPTAGEKYTITVNAFFGDGKYYTGTKTATTSYTHAAEIKIGQSLSVAPITKYDYSGGQQYISGYDVSIKWDVYEVVDSYALYFHEGTNLSGWDDWTSVTVTGGISTAIPAANVREITIAAPTLRQSYSYKLVAKKGTEEKALIGTLRDAAFNESFNSSFTVIQVTPLESKKLSLEVSEVSYGDTKLIEGETLTLYYAPISKDNTNDTKNVSASQIIENYKVLGSFTRSDLLTSTAASKRTVSATGLTAGQYEVVGIVSGSKSKTIKTYINYITGRENNIFTVSN